MVFFIYTIGCFANSQLLENAKISYYNGRIMEAYKILQVKNTDEMQFDEKVFFAKLNSELGFFNKAHNIYIQLDPIKHKDILAIPFLKNLLRWHKYKQALLYKKVLYIDNKEYYELFGDVYFALKQYKKAIDCYKQSLKKQETAYIYYKLAKAYYMNKDFNLAKNAIKKGLKIVKSRIIRYNLQRLMEITK